ncbi:hypothetical protein VCR31J2_460002 [Vibrio coralliirubri]|uniref:Uncharacterized protein n=1 Tax=Vibrio coralliirubri TaxID=1516159 RepID=A0AA86XR59_9VIBR|nr:hypothetical protein VCR6J2_30036 [Vibrio coralliirubri]CDT63258.1 hypothetical protein VCR1J2_80117 [Vibrio coralliirubri]CDT64882.1 hypothetical protein VCR26J2_30116 [Vibrio coralliirubri]CDT90999.1 hypothetical protein VCR8J2_40117 [Vibrio coralliirubri]CDT98635.1 hypothetical protein VCR31J2_460002 [Vibrio coralliirubri]
MEVWDKVSIGTSNQVRAGIL